MKNREKYTFIGEKGVMQRWINRFPEIVKLNADFIEFIYPDDYADLSPLSEELQNVSKQQIIDVSENNILTTSLLKNRMSTSDAIINISDFLSPQISDSHLMPSRIRIDASTLCQLNCKSCYMRLNKNGTMGSGYLSFDNYRKLIEENPVINEVELSNSGEIFLNPELIKIMEYSYAKGITLTAINGVNFNTVSDAQLEALVKFQFFLLKISIDGVSQETYSNYRVNGDYNVVIENIKKLNEYKIRYNSILPHIIWQFIVMEHNELDVPLAKIKAKELGISMWFTLTWDETYNPKHVDMLKRETNLEALTRNEYLNNTKTTYLAIDMCKQLLLSPQINWDGRLTGCCTVFSNDFGVNVFEVGLRKALQNKKFIMTKRCLLQREPVESMPIDSPCFNCKQWVQMKTMNVKFSLLE